MSLDLKDYKGFKVLKNDHSSESNALHIYCSLNEIPLLKVEPNNIFTDEFIPCGSVEWCEQLLGYHVKPDYYPEWCKNHLYRKVWESNEWILSKKLFVKPSDIYKRFNGFCTTGTYKKKKKPPFWYSEIIYFENEWRYYITKGKVVASGWYWGDGINTPDAPYLDIYLPINFCGAVDFGITKEGRLALVEVHHPFACGWYGKQKDDEKYFQWLIDGWIYMRGLNDKANRTSFR